MSCGIEPQQELLHVLSGNTSFLPVGLTWKEDITSARVLMFLPRKGTFVKGSRIHVIALLVRKENLVIVTGSGHRWDLSFVGCVSGGLRAAG
mmetsp:Transcript_52353/g.162505  ORF Transcript_52353/g.162505 Transcript_52353/m.162505 type:complete len:92 (-) Transcript_52353:606-881(-)